MRRFNAASRLAFLQFVEDFSAEISEMKLGLKTRGRAVVDEFWWTVEQRQQTQQQQQAHQQR